MMVKDSCVVQHLVSMLLLDRRSSVTSYVQGCIGLVSNITVSRELIAMEQGLQLGSPSVRMKVKEQNHFIQISVRCIFYRRPGIASEIAACADPIPPQTIILAERYCNF